MFNYKTQNAHCIRNDLAKPTHF